MCNIFRLLPVFNATNPTSNAGVYIALNTNSLPNNEDYQSAKIRWRGNQEG